MAPPDVAAVEGPALGKGDSGVADECGARSRSPVQDVAPGSPEQGSEEDDAPRPPTSSRSSSADEQPPLLAGDAPAGDSDTGASAPPGSSLSGGGNEKEETLLAAVAGGARPVLARPVKLPGTAVPASAPIRLYGGQTINHTVFVGGLPPWGDEASLIYFFGALGPLHNVKLVRDPHTGMSKRYAFVTFVEPQTAAAVKACQRLDFFGKLVDLGEPAACSGATGGARAAGDGPGQGQGPYTRASTGGAPAAAAVPVSNRVFVGGLPRDATEAQLTQFFGRFGPVVEFRIIYDPLSGHSKGFGFASFVRRADADAVKAKKSVTFMHRTLNVGEAKLNPNNSTANGSSAAAAGNGAAAAAAGGHGTEAAKEGTAA